MSLTIPTSFNEFFMSAYQDIYKTIIIIYLWGNAERQLFGMIYEFAMLKVNNQEKQVTVCNVFMSG